MSPADPSSYPPRPTRVSFVRTKQEQERTRGQKIRAALADSRALRQRLVVSVRQQLSALPQQGYNGSSNAVALERLILTAALNQLERRAIIPAAVETDPIDPRILRDAQDFFQGRRP